MNLHEWLATGKGRQSALAAHLGITVAAITQWRENGIPVVHMERIQRFTRRAVRLADMVRATTEARGSKERAA